MSGNTPNRTDLLNFLIKKYNLKRFLEIGVQNADQNFNKIECEYKVSVDPDPNAKATFCNTSDDFFNRYLVKYHPDLILFDIIFIDGLHTAEQVKKDFENALKVLSPKGFIVLHDCNPLKEEHTIVPRPTKTGHWQGDVYKFASTISKEYFFTIDIDCGTAVFSAKGIEGINKHGYLRNRPNWEIFDQNRKQLLNLITWHEFININS